MSFVSQHVVEHSSRDVQRGHVRKRTMQQRCAEGHVARKCKRSTNDTRAHALVIREAVQRVSWQWHAQHYDDRGDAGCAVARGRRHTAYPQCRHTQTRTCRDHRPERPLRSPVQRRHYRAVSALQLEVLWYVLTHQKTQLEVSHFSQAVEPRRNKSRISPISDHPMLSCQNEALASHGTCPTTVVVGEESDKDWQISNNHHRSSSPSRHENWPECDVEETSSYGFHHAVLRGNMCHGQENVHATKVVSIQQQPRQMVIQHMLTSRNAQLADGSGLLPSCFNNS